MNSFGKQTTSEIVDLTVKGGNKCNNWPGLPTGVIGATGGLIGNTVIICGGLEPYAAVDECRSLTSEKATIITSMSVARIDAASVVIKDNILWVTGGRIDCCNSLASTEYVTMTGSLHGPDMPMALDSHAMVAINSTFSLVIGGYTGESGVSSTFFYDHNEG